MSVRVTAQSWVSTLRLPKSKFHQRPVRSQQKEYLRRVTNELYEWQNRTRADLDPFIIQDGPPYANGKLHVGHALNKILKDLICRVKVQQGRRVTYIPGWDCHGLPIEINAIKEARSLHRQERKLEAETEPFKLNDFQTRFFARSLAVKTVEDQKNEFQTWGIMADWTNSWTTMDKKYGANQLMVFKHMVEKGLIFRRYKPVHWSPSSKTALAEAELVKVEKEDWAAFVRFPMPVVPESLIKKVLGLRDLSLVIWTTLPWTIPANRAVAIHRDLEYTIVRFKAMNLVVATSRLAHVEKMCFKNQDWQIISNSIMGADLEGAEYLNPIHGMDSQPRRIIHADTVSSESGSGLVHFAPGHGMEDYKICSQLGIEAFAPVDDRGCFTMEALPRDPWALKGTFVLDHGNEIILKMIEEHVLFSHRHKKQWLCDWRTKEPTIERATAQWFADVEMIKDDAVSRLDDVKFIPEAGRARLESFVKSRDEWCISRQRPWGVPLPALYNKDDGEALLTPDSVRHITDTISRHGSDAWWADAPDDPKWCTRKGQYVRGKDTLDVWFDSGTSWTTADGGIEGGKQADVYVEGSDQHRGWFQSSLLTYTSTSPSKTAPFKTLITHGFTLDETGRKMSKSEGNVIKPSQIMRGTLLPPVRSKHKGEDGKKILGEYFEAGLGADALRFWAASSDYTKDVIVGLPVLTSNNAALLKYRVTLKLLLGAMHPRARTAPITKLDQMALIQLHNVMKEVAAAYDRYEFYKAVHALNRWVHSDLSAFYLEALKDRLYCGDGGGALEEIFNGLLRMLSPITPSLVEEAWSYRPEWMKKESKSTDHRLATHPFVCSLNDTVMGSNRINSLPNGLEGLSTLEAEMPWIMNVKAAVNTALEEARQQKVVRSSLESSVLITITRDSQPLFEKYADELANMLVVSDVDLIDDISLHVSAADSGSGVGALQRRRNWSFEADFDAPGGKGTVYVRPPKANKCGRCWRYVAPVTDELCERCEDVVGELEAAASARRANGSMPSYQDGEITESDPVQPGMQLGSGIVPVDE